MNPFSTPRAWACALAGAALCLGMGVHAQDFPSKPIRLVVPFAPGGATDILARVLAEKMSPRLGQPVIVDNKAGAAGIIGTDAVAKAPADGYTLLLSLSNAMLTNVFLYEKLPYDPRRDLALVSQIATAPLVLVVHPSVQANSGSELLLYVGRNKGKLAYGSYGIGSYPHLAGALMSASQQADMSHVAYKGEAPMMQDLIGGQIQMAYASVLQAKPYIEAGKIKVIGITGERRVGALPNVPTLVEQGFKDEAYRMTGWLAIALPTGTPKVVVQRIAVEVRAACELPDVRTRIAAMGFEVKCSSPEAFAATYQQELPVWERLIKQSGAKVE
jgi:tripartite-type tricarboxylate transporter receptor subunit TctC